MYPEEEKLYQIEMKVGLLEKDIQQTNQVYERHITQRLDDLRIELIKHAKNDPNRLSNTLQEIDRYKWMILGGAIALGWLFGNINLGALGTLIK